MINSEIIKTNIAGLQYAVSTIGSVQMRNMATIGGNIANASPAGDSIPMLMVLDTKITTLFEGKIYNYDIINFFTGPGKSQLKSKEFILKISIPITQGYTQKFYKLGQREGIAISKINLAVNYKIEDSIISDIKISLGAVAPTVVRARKTEEFLINKKISDEIITLASNIIKTECSPITDIRSTSEYRKLVAGNLLLQFFRELNF